MSLFQWSDMLEEIVSRTDKGEIIAGSIQYMTADGKIWMKTVDGDIEVSPDILAQAGTNYAQLMKKGN